MAMHSNRAHAGLRRGLYAGCAAAVLLCACAARADLIHLRNGKVLHGEVVSDDGQTIVVRVPYGQLSLRAEQVEFVERQTKQEYRLEVGREYLAQKRFGPAIDQLEAAFAAGKDSAEARQALADGYGAFAAQLRAGRRLTEALGVYRKLLAVQPGHAAARAALAGLDEDLGRLKTLVAAARAAMAGGDLDAAVARFEKALAFSLDAKDEIAADLALCHARRGEAHYQAGRYEQATAELERAFGYDVRLADSLEGLYSAGALSIIVARINDGRLLEARAGLVRVLSFAPANRTVLYVSGRIEEKLGNLKGAVEAYGQALRTRPAAVTPEAMVRMRQDLEKALALDKDSVIRFNVQPVDVSAYARADDGDFAALETEHFRIFHHNAALAAELGRVLEAHRERIAAALTLTAEWKEKARVYLHRTQEEYTLATGQPEWSGGVSRFIHSAGRISRMEIHSWQTSPRLLKSVVPHELTHLLVNTNLSSYELLPRALHEGFAVYMEPDFRQAYFRNYLHSRMEGKEYLPLSELLTMQDYPRDQEVFYAQGYALVAFLIQHAGMERAVRLIKNADSKPTFEARLLEAAGYASLEKLEEDFKAWLRAP